MLAMDPALASYGSFSIPFDGHTGDLSLTDASLVEIRLFNKE